MKGAYKAALILFAPVVTAKALDMFLKSGSGRKLVERSGNDVLATPQGREIAKKYSGVATGIVTGALGAKHRELGEGLRSIGSKKGADWLGVAEDTAAILLAVGALIKAIADFAREKRKAARRAAAHA